MSRHIEIEPAPHVAAPAAPRPGEAGWLTWWDLVVCQTSAGKDSQTAMRAAVHALEAAGMLGRTVAIAMHMDLGARVEWPQVPELAREQARRNGLALVVASRAGVDLLDDIRARRKRDGAVRGWPGAGLRYCTSDHKTAPSRRAIEAMCEHIRERDRLARPVRVLQVMGFRAAESKRRAELDGFAFNARQSASTKRHVFDWLPIQGMSTGQVWADIRVSGVPYHPAYDEGMTRLSCKLCVLASRGDLSTARRLAPEVADQYIAAEYELGLTFQNGRSRESIEPAAGPGGLDVHWLSCPTCGVDVLASTRECVRACPAHATSGPWDVVGTVDSGPGCGPAGWSTLTNR